jgi:hypothetical protein
MTTADDTGTWRVGLEQFVQKKLRPVSGVMKL